MTISSSDISLVYSGGSNNNSALLSIGGEPSSFVVTSNINNLFDDVNKSEAEVGSIEYRCIYCFNNNLTDTFYDVEIYISSETSGGSAIEIGVEKFTDVQRLSASGTITGGSLVLSYNGTSFSFNYNANISIWAQNLQTALNNLADLSGVVVVGSSVGSSRFLEIRFEGADDNRNHPLILIINNSGLTGSYTLTLTKLVEGAPINTIATQLDFETSTPFNVEFSAYDVDTPLIIGTLKPLEGFPIWSKRTTPALATAVANDSFNLRISGSPIQFT